jgi:hypothetical protein
MYFNITIMKFKQFFIFTLLIISNLNAFSQIVDAAYKANQPKENAPLSRLGLGNLYPQYTIASAGMGGLTSIYRDPFIYNPQNPASLPNLKATAFEVGFYGKNTNVTDSKNQSGSAWAGNLNHVALAFPTYSVINEIYDRKPRQVRWGMGLSLMPYNNVGYNISTTGKAPNTDTVTVSSFYLGSGGTYRAMWGNGFSYKGLSAGLNLGYIFGKMNYIRQLDLSSNLATPYADYFEDFYTLSGLTWNAGLQYDITLDPKSKVGDKGGKKHLVLGAYGNPASNFNTVSGSYYRRVGNTTDTISTSKDIVGTGKLPNEFTIGVSYENALKFRLGVEYKAANWSQYRNDARRETMKNATQFAIGTEFILNKSKLKTDEEKIRYRLGFRTGTDPRLLNNEQLKHQTFSAGMCFPMRVGRGSQISFLSLGLEYDKLGTAKLNENAVRILVGFTLNDNTWFLKRKIE